MTPAPDTVETAVGTWWHRGHRPYDEMELLVDAIVHTIGIFIALVVGLMLVLVAGFVTAPQFTGILFLYVASLLCVLAASLAFNQWPIDDFKMHLAKLDQAAIFLFLAGSYTPFLAILGEAGGARTLLFSVWVLSTAGIALKIFIPNRFGRVAILLHLGIGWSALLILPELMKAMPPTAFTLLVAGGVVYSLGIIFHLWERLRFHNAIWHAAVVIGALLHMAAIVDCMVISRLWHAA